jgi:hypothetical protein
MESEEEVKNQPWQRKGISHKFFSPTNAPFIKHIKCQNLQLKYLYIPSYMFRPIRTILRELRLSLAKVNLL